ncbi:hypothetical protein [Pedobacter sp. JCM 36344]|uniref:hypothetical protein n=1 Tax=Pedobacter sp. JCM 36344 TaxID=3374280 RepID=UPI00397E65A1
MKNFTKLLSFLLVTAFVFNGCRNPAYEVNVLFDAQVITYKAGLQLTDANGGTLPGNIDVTVTGTDAGSIYDFSGTKKIYAPNGVITLGVHPKEIPTASKTLSFNVIVKIPGYEEKNIPMTIAVNQFSQEIKGITMVKTAVPTPYTSVVVKDFPLGTGGATTTISSFSTPSTAGVPQTTSIAIPAGTTFRDANGTLLTGGALTAQAINFDAGDPELVSLFPGGDLSAPNVIGKDGTVGEAFFSPAGFTDITMYVGGVEVKKFSTPINVSIQVDPTFKLDGSTTPVKAGDVLSVYSYQVSTGQFKYETEVAAIVDGGGKLAIPFTTDHLTKFIVGQVFSKKACKIVQVTFIAPWLGANSTVVSIEILTLDGTKRLDYTKSQVLFDGTKVDFKNLPPFAVSYIVRQGTTAIAAGNITNPCDGTALSVTLPNPATPVDLVTLLLNVKCPQGQITVPRFDLYYKAVGTPDSQYTLLGTVINGSIKTTLLKVGTSYDFRAYWGNTIKTVGNRPITTADMSTTVGENDFLGTKSPQYNKSLLIEACKGI